MKKGEIIWNYVVEVLVFWRWNWDLNLIRLLKTKLFGQRIYETKGFSIEEWDEIQFYLCALNQAQTGDPKQFFFQTSKLWGVNHQETWKIRPQNSTFSTAFPWRSHEIGIPGQKYPLVICYIAIENGHL